MIPLTVPVLQSSHDPSTARPDPSATLRAGVQTTHAENAQFAPLRMTGKRGRGGGDATRCDAMRCDAKKQQVPRCARDDSRVVLTGEGTIQTGVGTSCIVPLQTKNESKSGQASSPLHEKSCDSRRR